MLRRKILRNADVAKLKLLFDRNRGVVISDNYHLLVGFLIVTF